MLLSSFAINDLTDTYYKLLTVHACRLYTCDLIYTANLTFWDFHDILGFS